MSRNTNQENQRRVFEFFKDHLRTKASFSPAEIHSVTDWSDSTFTTYWSKQFKPFLIHNRSGQYRVSEAFRPFTTWEKFQQHVTQVRRVISSDYQKLSYDFVWIYEFFMPLTNEGFLRTALDSLFYRDSIEASILTIPPEELHAQFKKLDSETEYNYNNRLYEWISDHFGGYSIYHVNGRFRAGNLVSRQDAAGMDRYLVDETTAVARFIFPCETSDEANLVAFFFSALFVQAIIEVINGEDEIWMTETGMENRLHIWRT